MDKIFHHSENIQRMGVKRQFQIKLPRTATSVSGILLTAQFENMEKSLSTPYPNYSGWLQLSIPEKRDTFYSELIAFENHQQEQLSAIHQFGLGIVEKDERWFNDLPTDFYSIHVPIENTIIDGYYEDLTPVDVPYKLNIYLKIN